MTWYCILLSRWLNSESSIPKVRCFSISNDMASFIIIKSTQVWCLDGEYPEIVGFLLAGREANSAQGGSSFIMAQMLVRRSSLLLATFQRMTTDSAGGVILALVPYRLPRCPWLLELHVEA